MVQGINAGRVVVHVKLQNTAWQNVPSDSVQLIIKENMMLKPNWPVFIIPLSYVDYTVWRRKQGWVEGQVLVSLGRGTEGKGDELGMVFSSVIIESA